MAQMQLHFPVFMMASLIAPVSFAVNCYVCINPTGECNSGSCESTWCMEQVVRSPKEGRYVVNKRCTDVNPIAGEKEDCVKVSKDGTDSITCVCSSQDFCNSQDFLKKFPAFAASPSDVASPSSNVAIATKSRVWASQILTNHSTSLEQQNQQTLNNAAATTNAAAVSTSTTTNVASAAYQCYQCQSNMDDCTSGSCLGSWCVSNVIRNDETDTYTISKDCLQGQENQNPFAKGSDDCTTNRNFPGQTQVQCTCRGALCNSRSNIERLYALLNYGEKLFNASRVAQLDGAAFGTGSGINPSFGIESGFGTNAASGNPFDGGTIVSVPPATNPALFHNTNTLSGHEAATTTMQTTTPSSHLLCHCSETHLGIVCDSGMCYGLACLTFNGTQTDSRGQSTVVSYQSCEYNIVRNSKPISFEQGPFCETSQFSENSAYGPLQYEGMSCFCNREKCNTLKSTESQQASSNNNIVSSDLDDNNNVIPQEISLFTASGGLGWEITTTADLTQINAVEYSGHDSHQHHEHISTQTSAGQSQYVFSCSRALSMFAYELILAISVVVLIWI